MNWKAILVAGLVAVAACSTPPESDTAQPVEAGSTDVELLFVQNAAGVETRRRGPRPCLSLSTPRASPMFGKRPEPFPATTGSLARSTRRTTNNQPRSIRTTMSLPKAWRPTITRMPGDGVGRATTLRGHGTRVVSLGRRSSGHSISWESARTEHPGKSQPG